MSILIKNIKKTVQTENSHVKKVCGKDMSIVNTLDNSFIFTEKDKIVDFGKMSDLEDKNYFAEKIIDASGKMVFPSFCDSHTHLVYAGSREIEYIDKIKGLSYEEIAKRGGGILNSAKLLSEISEDELYEQSFLRINEIVRQGTGAVEIKTGYGLKLEAELKMLRVIKRLQETAPITIKATYLAAHAVPREYKSNQTGYVNYVISEIMPAIANEKTAEFIDVFCDKGFFTVSETDKILSAGAKYGLIPKIHANELDFSGGIQVATKYNALSADHLEYVGENEIKAFKNSRTMPTILPGAAFFLNLPISPARKMINAGLPLAIASDFNPGSSPSGNMKLMSSIAMINYKLTSQELINATTINTAYAMGVSDTHGSIAVGKKANLFITKEIPTVEYFHYSFGSDLVDKIILNGNLLGNS